MIATENELSHFIEVYTTKHFTRSAIKLGIAQPSLTQSILKLEKKTGTTLFHRTKQGAIPTRSADLFYSRAIQLREMWKTLSDEITHSNESLSGVFRLGCHPSVGAYTLPNLFKTLSKQAPDIEIRLHHDLSRKITEKIISYELDAGFVVNPILHHDLVLTPIGVDRVAFWRSSKHNPPRIIFADLSLTQTQTILNKKHASRFSQYKIVETSSLELARTLVASGAGIGILPERVAHTQNNDLEIVDSKLPVFHDKIYLAYRVGALKSQAGKTLLHAAKTCIAPLV